MIQGTRRFVAVIAAMSIMATGAFAANSPSQAKNDSLPGGATSLSETHGDWVVSCHVLEKKDKSERVCSMSQQQTNDKGQRALAVDLHPSGEGAIGIIILPFGVAVTKGVDLAVDGTKLETDRPYSTCMQIGCLIPLTFGKKDINLLDLGKKLTVTATALPGRSFTLSASLKGFEGALNRTRELLKD